MAGAEAREGPAGGAGIPPVGSGSYPLRTGNAVLPLVDGGPAFREIGRAVETARHRVWVTVAFIEPDVRLPGGAGTFFDLLNRAAARGLDVRVIFWRTRDPSAADPETHFPGTEAQRAILAGLNPRLQVRWDRLPGPFCHHQKSWLTDAGADGETAFVGGINLDRASMDEPGHRHREGESIHDVYLRIRGPAATDVHHNFVQRWNGASERLCADGCWPPGAAGTDLEFPHRLSPPAGSVPVQVTRTVRPGRYRGSVPAPGADPYEISRGESSVRDQYLAAIDAARRAIYCENQTIASPAVIDRLDAALRRGVEVVFLVPCRAHPDFAAARRDPGLLPLFRPLHDLKRHSNFTLAGLAVCRGSGRCRYPYVHAKILQVDDRWLTVGSTNVADRSFTDDTEMNASIWCPETARRLRIDLMREHLGADTGRLDCVAALRLFARAARENARRHRSGRVLQGLALALDTVEYGLPFPAAS